MILCIIPISKENPKVAMPTMKNNYRFLLEKQLVAKRRNILAEYVGEVNIEIIEIEIVNIKLRNPTKLPITSVSEYLNFE